MQTRNLKMLLSTQFRQLTTYWRKTLPQKKKLFQSLPKPSITVIKNRATHSSLCSSLASVRSSYPWRLGSTGVCWEGVCGGGGCCCWGSGTCGWGVASGVTVEDDGVACCCCGGPCFASRPSESGSYRMVTAPTYTRWQGVPMSVHACLCIWNRILF